MPVISANASLISFLDKWDEELTRTWKKETQNEVERLKMHNPVQYWDVHRHVSKKIKSLVGNSEETGLKDMHAPWCGSNNTFLQNRAYLKHLHIRLTSTHAHNSLLQFPGNFHSWILTTFANWLTKKNSFPSSKPGSLKFFQESLRVEVSYNSHLGD